MADEGNWHTSTLGQLAERVTVGHVGPMMSEYVDHGVPFLRSQNIEPLRINTSDLKFISKEFHAKLSKSRLSPGDVVIVRTGKPGACAVIPDWLSEANCSDLVIVRPGPLLDPRFLAYYVNAVAYQHVEAHLVGAVQQHFNVASARQIKVRTPPISEQRAIVRILGTLDDKIELNQRINRLLEEMTKTIYKTWFVDFGPVKAKASGATSFPGMPMDAFDDLPNRLVESTFGKVPNGWDVVPFSDLMDLLSGGTPRRNVPEYWNGDIPWFSVRDAPPDGDLWTIDTEERITEVGVRNSAAKIMRPGVTIISARGTVGRLALTAVPMAMNQSCYGVQGREGVGDFFVYFSLLDAVADLQQRTHGSVFSTITRKTFDLLNRVRPPGRLLDAFEEVVRPYLEFARENRFESRTLADLRDALLPKLISGQLRVPGTEWTSNEGT